jgi:hypothetical protein
VDIIHALEDHTGEYQQAAVDTVMDIHCNHPEGAQSVACVEGGVGVGVGCIFSPFACHGLLCML